MLSTFLKFFFSENIFNIDVQVKSKLKKHLTKVHFKVVSKYKRFFQLKNRFLAVNMRTLFLRISRKWSFRDSFFFKRLSIFKFKFFSYKLALILRQLLKYLYICNEKTFKRNILDKFINFSNRLDLVCIRVHFFKNILDARIGIVKGFVHINGEVITYWNFYLKKYDFVTLHIPQEYKKARNFIAHLKRIFRYRWRRPLFLRSLNLIFNYLNQLRLAICEISFFFKFYFSTVSMHLCFFFFVYMRCFNVLKCWVRLFKMLLVALPRTYLIGLYYLKRFFKRKINNFITMDRERRKKFLKKKFYAGIKRFKGKRGFLGFVYFYQDSIKAAAAELPYTYKRVDKGLRITRYVSFFSRFMLFFFMSSQIFSIRYQQRRFDILGKSISFFFLRVRLYNFIYLIVAYPVFLAVLNAIRLGACFIYYNYRATVDSVIVMNKTLNSPKRKHKFVYVIKKIGSKRIVKLKRVVDPLLRTSRLLLFFGKCFKFHFLFCYLYFIRFFKTYFNLFLYIRFYAKLRRLGKYKSKSLRLRYIFKKSKPSRRRRRRSCIIKRRFRTYSLNPVRGFGSKTKFSIFFFNIFLYFNCIDFEFVEIAFLPLRFRKYMRLFFAKSDLKFNYMNSLYYFFNLEYSCSLFFLFFNMDNLFRFMFMYFTIRNTVYLFRYCRTPGVRHRKFGRVFHRIVNCWRFNLFFFGYHYCSISLIFQNVSLFLNRFNAYLRKLEYFTTFSRIKFKRLFFFILSMFYYLFRMFGFFHQIRHMFRGGFIKILGLGYFNIVYNKFFIYNWYNKKLIYIIYAKYGFNFFKLNNLYMYSQSMYLYRCFNFFKKLTTFFRKNLKFFNLYIYLILSILGIRFSVVSRLRCFIMNKALVVVSDYFFFFLISFCFRILYNVYENVFNLNYKYSLFDFIFNDSFNINLFLFKLKFNLYFFLFKCLKLRFRIYLKIRYYKRLSPMFLRNTFVRQTLKRTFPVYWSMTYTFRTSAAYRTHQYNYLYMRQFLCNYILRYHFNLRIGASDFIRYRYLRKIKTNFFFSKSFLYYDIEYNTTAYPGFIYIGDSNSYIRRLQIRFNFFMTLILRFYAHAKSLVRK